MNNKGTTVDNPLIRLPTIDSGRLKNNKTSMIGLLEIDVTNLREQIKVLHKQGCSFSFTACILKLLGDTVSDNQIVQARLLTDRKLVLYEDVDISISIERYSNGIYFPFPLIIRSVNKKSIKEIDTEIQNEVNKKIDTQIDLFMPEKPKSGKILLSLFFMLSSKLRVAIIKIMTRTPMKAKKTIGTVGFATVNMTGRLSGWTLPTKNPYSLYIALGSVNKKPVVVNDKIVAREMLNMTAIFDHNVIDGAPAKRFMNDFVSRIENTIIDINKK
jgi:pyruvate/2-oxoglutarate dehydrogenase complex dihydrolipoamide acyltransferase (E2) component